MTRAAWQEIVGHVERGCAAVGFDLVHPFNAAACDWQRLGGPRAPKASGLGLLIGNTRQLWPRFVAACRADPELADAANPLDRYVVERLSAIASRAGAEARLIFGHVTEPAPFPLQRLAQQVGLASLAPSHLAIHPLHGPWFALRALMLVEVDGPPFSACPRVNPCAGCAAPCVPALEKAVAVSGTPLDSAAIARHAREWIAVRDACPVGTASRYSPAQLDYHYAPARAKLLQGS